MVNIYKFSGKSWFYPGAWCLCTRLVYRGFAPAHVEAAVLWLARTILEVLFAGKMEAWIRQVGLTDDTGRLKSEIERAEAVVAAVKGRAAENRPLARSLGRLKELLYDADDMVDELDYYRLQHQVQGGMCTRVPRLLFQ